MIGYSLGRPEMRFDASLKRAFYAEKRVLITGAAGSVGSALALRLAEIGCAHLALLDQFDHGLIEITEAAQHLAPSLDVADVLCDIRDANRLDAWMRRVAPDIVIHAAALKHVHLGERHPVECVLTNLVGVRNALSAAAKAGASHFILVSTDKAAAPVCVMGATKRLAELHLAGFEIERGPGLKARSVRFGNVLGSQGSVLPRFEKQIEAGGPVEITHPEMERFFMTPREAVGLILSVGALEDEGAGSYFMQMGEAISIMDIGRSMIKRSGRDIKIEITGLRPGEKLHEQLTDEYEAASPTAMPDVFRVTPRASDAFITTTDIAQLENMARTLDHAIVRQRVFALLDRCLRRGEAAVG